MPKKKEDKSSKKNVQKKKDKMIEDKTFGLKNKNKSKKVQQFVQSTVNSIKNSGDRKEMAAKDKARQDNARKKEAKKAAEDERNALFGEALMAVSKKTSTKLKGNVQAVGRDGGDDEKKVKPGQSRAMKMM